MKFRNKWQSQDSKKYTNPGSPIKIVGEAKMDKHNNLEIVKKGEESLYNYIQSFADSADINVIMTKFLNGDREVLLQRAGAYLDISSLPKSFQELVDIRLAAENVYDTLPVEVKEQFGNNVNNFISTMGSENWIKIMNTSQADIFKEKNREVRARKEKLENEVLHGEPIKVTENPAVDAGKDGANE